MELLDYIRFLLALVFVLGLIGVLVVLARRYGLASRMVLPSGGRGRGKRLKLVEIMAIDPKRRLILLRRDDREHLILLTGQGPDLLIERDIEPPGQAADFQRHLRDAADTPPPEPAP